MYTAQQFPKKNLYEILTAHVDLFTGMCVVKHTLPFKNCSNVPGCTTIE